MSRTSARALRLSLGALLLALIAGEAILPGRYLSRRDTFRLHLPLREFVAHEWSEGRFPTWNPLDGLGSSVQGTAVTASTHPLQLLLLFLPPDVALKWQVLLCLLLAGLGAGLLGRRLGGPEAGWWLAGIAYGGSGYLVSATDNFTYLHGAALLPWVLLCAERLGERPSWPRGVALGGVLALGLHGGDVQGALLASMLSGIWTVAVSRERAAAALQVLLAGVVTVLLSAPLLPAIAATALDSGRAAGLAPAEAMQWSLSPLRLLELPLGPLIPVELLDFHGPLLSRALGGHTGALWVASEFVGAAVLILAPAGLLRGARPSARRYAILAGVGLVLALGSVGGLYPLLLKTVPGWSAFRYPEKLMPLTVLGLGLLAAHGLAQRSTRAAATAAALLGGLLLPLALGLTPSAVTWVFERLGAALSPELAEPIADGLRARASAALLACAALGLTAWRRPAALGWVAATALGLQAAWCARGLMETRPRDDLSLTPDLLEAVRQAGGERTRLAAWPERYTFRGERFAATAAARRGDFEALAPEHNMRFGVGNLYAYLPGTMGELERACSARPQCTSTCARRLGARLCIVSPELVQPTVARGAVVLARSERQDQPRLALLSDERARAWASVPGIRKLEQTSGLREAFLQEEPTLPALLLGAEADYPPAPDAVTSWKRLRSDHALVELTLEQENYLVVAEQCAPGWSATVDELEVAPVRVDGGLCAVKVSAGRHLVQLRYLPPGWPWAWAVFGIGMLCVVAVLARSLRIAWPRPEAPR